MNYVQQWRKIEEEKEGEEKLLPSWGEMFYERGVVRVVNTRRTYTAFAINSEKEMQQEKDTKKIK